MKRTWYVFRHTYWEHVRRPGFYIVIFLLPALIFVVPIVLALISVFVIGTVVPPSSELPVGVVDESRFVLPAVEALSIYEAEGDDVTIWQFETRVEAEMALRAGHIQGYVRFPADFAETGEVFGRYSEENPPSLMAQIETMNWIERQARGEIDETYQRRLIDGSEIVHIQLQPVAEADTAVDNSVVEDTTSAGEASLGFGLLMIILYLGRMMSIFTSGFMYESVREESKNRTIEILLTTISPGKLVTGKILGMLAVGLTQLAVFSAIPLLFIIWIGAQASDNPTTAGLLPDLPWGLFFLFIAGGYLLDQLVAAGTGLLRISGGAGPQVANLLGGWGWLA
jgi:ABC-2 type transport system permease protein